MSKLIVARALTAHIAKRMLRLATILALLAFVIITLIIGALAYFFSAWWWLLIIPFLFVLSLFLVVRLFVVLIVRRIHGDHMNKTQRDAMDDFTGKIEALIEARATPLPIFVFICIKDLVLHRDITTVKKLISDSTGLKKDYAELEKLF